MTVLEHKSIKIGRYLVNQINDLLDQIGSNEIEKLVVNKANYETIGHFLRTDPDVNHSWYHILDTDKGQKGIMMTYIQSGVKGYPKGMRTTRTMPLDTSFSNAIAEARPYKGESQFDFVEALRTL